MRKIKLAICQNKPGLDKKENIRQVLRMIKEAAAQNANLIMLPEMFYYSYELKRIPHIAEEQGETLSLLQKAAAELELHICTGSLAVKTGNKIYNRSYLIDPRGKIILEYSKSQLFDVDLPHLSVRESAVFSPGSEWNVAETSLGNIGILICFDIRFPETARKLVKQGAEIILVPAAFNTITGPAHWHITMRTRAVENQCYLAAASPARNPESGYKAYGHSLVVDPWGKILSEAGIGEEIIYSELDPAVLTDVRLRLPLLKKIGF